MSLSQHASSKRSTSISSGEEVINSLSTAMEKRDPYTTEHQYRVAKLVKNIAQRLNLPLSRVENITLAASIHDIGKLSIPMEILTKPNKLEEEEFNLIKKHPEAGCDIISKTNLPESIRNAIFQHHERLDGSGYPQGLKGSQISLGARIIGVADTVEAMASHRPYRPAVGVDKALEEIFNNRKELYDSKVVKACLEVFNEQNFKFD